MKVSYTTLFKKKNYVQVRKAIRAKTKLNRSVKQTGSDQTKREESFNLP